MGGRGGGLSLNRHIVRRGELTRGWVILLNSRGCGSSKKSSIVCEKIKQRYSDLGLEEFGELRDLTVTNSSNK
jgi:hypothetical protein